MLDPMSSLERWVQPGSNFLQLLDVKSFGVATLALHSAHVLHPVIYAVKEFYGHFLRVCNDFVKHGLVHAGLSSSSSCCSCRFWHCMLPRQLHCSLLLALPDKDLERRFWEDDHTLKTYTYWDAYISTNMIISNIIMTKTLFRALADPTVLRHTWHMHVNILLNLVACTANLLLIFRHRTLYKRNRHRFVICQRLLRLLMMFVAVYQSSESLQAALARALNVKQPAAAAGVTAAAMPVLKTVVLNLTRPLFVGPVITMAHASWVFRTKYWLPLQLLTFFLAVLGSVRHQHCRMAADPSSALLLQPTCSAMSDLHHFIAGSILGPMLLVLTSNSSFTNPVACATMPVAARTLGWYAQAVYGVFMPIAGFCTLEWRLKAGWVYRKLGKQLVYGPWGWPRSEHESGTVMLAVQNIVSWLLAIAAGLGLLWVGVTWVVPQLPLMPCQTCADRGTCQPIECEGGICSSPGHWTALVLYGQMLFVLIGHLAVTRFV